MHILVINFNLKGISEEDYRGLVEPIAPAFAGLPGLISKTWLANKETDTYGGVYVWSDREAMEAYKQTDIYKGMQANPHFENVTVTDFAVVENATRVTRGKSKSPPRGAASRSSRDGRGRGIAPAPTTSEGDSMRQTHTTRQAVRPGAEQWHGNSRKEGPDPHRFTHRNHASKPGSRLRIVATLGGVAFVEESSTG